MGDTSSSSTTSRYLSAFTPASSASSTTSNLHSRQAHHQSLQTQSSLTSNHPNHHPSQPPPTHSSNSSNCSPYPPARSITPVRYLTSGSPLPPTSAYALVSSTRSLGTPTSDIRATSPTAQDRDPTQINPSTNLDWNSLQSPTSPFECSTHPPPPPPPPAPTPTPTLSSIDCSLANHDSSSAQQHYLPSVVVQPSSSSYLDTHLSKPSRLDCFWAILDDELKFVYVDPSLQRELQDCHLDRLLSSSIYQYIHPADLDQVMTEIDPDHHLFLSNSSSHHHPSDPSRPQPQHSGLMLSSPASTAVDRKLTATHRVIRNCRLARSDYFRQLLRREEPYLTPGSEDDLHYGPVQVFLNPIGESHLLCFFHALPDLPPTQLQSAVEHGALPAWPPLPTPCPPASTCGVMDSNPSSFAFTREESLKLETAMVQSAQNRAEAISPRDRSPSNPHSNALDVFQVLDSTTGAVLFSYPPPNPSPLDHWAGRYRPEEYAYLAMNTKQSRHCGNDSPGQTTCSTKYTTQHSLLKEGGLVPVNQSFVINYGSLTFASFRTGSPPPPSQPNSIQPPSSPIAATIKPPPMELVRDPAPIPLDLYSSHSASSIAHRAPKRPRTDSYPDVLTPQSASSIQSQHATHYHPHAHPSQSPYSYAHPHHPASAQLSPLVSNLPTIPDSPDPYGSSQYTHFSGELSPTMASAANVLGSFHRAAHYRHHPSALMGFQDVHRTGPSDTALSPFETSYGLQSLANMAVGGYDPRRGAPDFSPTSACSSPRPGAEASSSYGAGGVNMAISPTTPNYGMRRRAHGHSASVDMAAHSLLGIGQATGGMVVSYGASTDDFGTRSPVQPQTVAPPPPPPTALPLAKPPLRMRGSEMAGGGGGVVAEVSNGGGGGGAQQVPRSCSSCGAQNSPEWRKGPNGVKSLCNACGLRFSRAQARKTKGARSSNHPSHHQKKLNNGGEPLKKKLATTAEVGGRNMGAGGTEAYYPVSSEAVGVVGEGGFRQAAPSSYAAHV